MKNRGKSDDGRKHRHLLPVVSASVQRCLSGHDLMHFLHECVVVPLYLLCPLFLQLHLQTQLHNYDQLYIVIQQDLG